MTSKMQLHAVGEMCPGYVFIGNTPWMPTQDTSDRLVSCETCIHWENNKCNVDLFDKVLSSLDQT